MPALWLLLVSSIAAWAAGGAKPGPGKPDGAAAQPSVGAVGANIDKVLAYYHTEDLLDQSMKKLEEAVLRRRKESPVTDAQLDLILVTARKIYRGSNLYPVFRAAYTKAMHLSNLNALRQWQNSPLGITLGRGLQATAKAEPTALTSYYEKEAPIVLKPNRRNAINTLVTVSEQDKLLATYMLGADFGVWIGLEVQKPRVQRERQKVLREKLKARRTGYNEPARASAMAALVYTVKDMKNEEIDAVTAFYGTAAGIAVVNAYNKALEHTLEQAALTLGTNVDKAASKGPG